MSSTISGLSSAYRNFGLYGTSAVSATGDVTGSSQTGATQADSSSGIGSGKDTATISEAAKQLSRMLAQAKGEGSSDTESTDPVEKLKKRIAELQKKIAEAEQSAADEATKQATVKGLQAELSSLNQELSDLLKQQQASVAAETSSGSGLSTRSGSGSSSGTSGLSVSGVSGSSGLSSTSVLSTYSSSGSLKK